MADTTSAEAASALAAAAAAAASSSAAIPSLVVGDGHASDGEPVLGGHDGNDDPDGENNATEDINGGFLDGRPDLSQDAIENLRAQHLRLKEQQKKVRRDMKNQKRMRSRIIKRVKHLDTASVLQVLIERGVTFGTLRGAAGVAAAANAVASAQATRAAAASQSSASSR
jgi:hypothetical protein